MEDVLTMRAALIRLVASFFLLASFYAALGFIFDGDSLRKRFVWMKHPEKEEPAIKATIDRYNSIFMDLYASDGVPLQLNDFPASKQLRHELFRNLGFLRQNKLILVYDMASRVFVEINRPSPSTAEALVFEEWNYVYQKAPTRALAKGIKGMGEGFRYMLEKGPQGWIIVDYYPEHVEIVKKDEFYY